MMRIMKIVWENTTPSTKLPRDFCAGIGPLQLSIVLVCSFIQILEAVIQILEADIPNHLLYKS